MSAGAVTPYLATLSYSFPSKEVVPRDQYQKLNLVSQCTVEEV